MWVIEIAPVSLGGGAVARVIRDGQRIRVQNWNGLTKTWVDGGMTPEMLRAIDMAPPARPEVLARLGIPDQVAGEPA